LKLKIIVFQINILQRLVFETLINLLEKSIVDVIDIEIVRSIGGPGVPVHLLGVTGDLISSQLT
jgi:hypothetical protein